MTIVPHPEFVASFELTGRAAHITAAAPNGPRYDHSLSDVERKSAGNGIWLCADCADLIDKKGGRNYSVGQIKSWKQQAEKEVLNAALLADLHREPRWIERLGSPHYINVPRIQLMCEQYKLSDETVETLQEGFPRRGWIVPELQDVRNMLRHAAIRAVDVEQIVRPDVQIQPGLIFSFFGNGKFRVVTRPHPHGRVTLQSKKIY